jgi:hypothetical protein
MSSAQDVDISFQGEAAAIVQDALSFQNLLDRLKQLEQDLRLRKLECLWGLYRNTL